MGLSPGVPEVLGLRVLLASRSDASASRPYQALHCTSEGPAAFQSAETGCADGLAS